MGRSAGARLAAAGLFLGVAGFAVAQESTVVRVLDAAGAPVQGAVIYLEGDEIPVIEPAARAVVDQRDKTFVPRVTVVQTGTEIEFPNSDSVSHHVYSFAQPNAFELPLYKGQSRPTVRFDHPGIVTLGCNIHDSMLGYIVVVDTPYFGVTDEKGSVTLAGVSPDEYRISVWSPRLDSARALPAHEVTATEDSGGFVLRVGRRQRPRPAAGGASLAWEDY